jgi:hypothetical protein
MEHVSTVMKMAPAEIGAPPEYDHIAIFKCKRCGHTERQGFDPNATP